MTDERRDELSTADLAGQRPTTTGRTDDRVDDADLDSRRETVTDDRAVDTDADGRADTMAERPVDTGRADTGAEGRADTVAEDRADERAGAAAGAAPGADRPRADDGATDGTAVDGTAAAPAGSATGPLLASSDAEGFRARWTDVQTGFVDSPRQAVERADALVAEVMQHLAKTFADERNGLERQWDRGGDVSTDDLRNAFQRYRSFFERLLST
jgi:hypothetical protein